MARAARTRRLALWLAFVPCIATCAGTKDGTRPNVLLVTLDTTRADHLGAYGYSRPTSPHLDALAAHAIRYTRGYSTSSWTLPAHASLFTGKFPSSHGARFDPEGGLVLSEVIDAPRSVRARALGAGESTLAQRLADAGYATAGFVGGPWMLRGFGLAAGFEHYDDTGITDHGGRRAEEITRLAREWLEARGERGETRPFFLFLNLFDPHFPYDPPPLHARAFLPARVAPNPNQRSQFRSLYDGEIHYMDAQLGAFLDFLRERSLYDPTLIVVTADHGELFGEHGEWAHGGNLYEELVAIPLLVKPAGPPRSGRIENEPTQLQDVFRLILAAAGVDAPSRGAQRLLAEVNPRSATSEQDGWKAIWEGPLKYHHSSRGRHRLFDLERDPEERVDLIETRPDDAERLRERLELALSELPPPPPPGPALEVDAETREALERLSYLP